MRKPLIALTALVALAGAGCFSLPHALRWQVQRRLPPGVQVRAVDATWGRVTLTGVTIDRGWVRGTVDRIVTDWDQRFVVAEGGDLDVDLDARQPGTGAEASKRQIEASGLTVRVKRGQHRATLIGARLASTRVCFDRATLDAPRVTADVGCVERDGSRAEAERVTADGITTHGLTLGSISAGTVFVDLQTRSVRAAALATHLTVEGQSVPVEVTGLEATEAGRVKVATLRTQHAWFAPDWLAFDAVTVVKGATVDVRVAASTLRVDPDTLTIAGDEPCQTWVTSLPSALRVPPLDTVTFSGTASFQVTLRPKPSIAVKASCRATCSTLPDLRKPFTYRAYTPKGERFERTTGPGSRDWLPVAAMGHLTLAVPSLEDPGFAHHRGFIAQAFENSLTDNLKHGRFLRGGSTLTMQLAKNLWLTREKTIGRKAQEFLLAQAIESCYSKDEILALYLNAVEFGPEQYGAAAGAQHWFKKAPAELTATEAFWLASILPRPSRTAPPTEASLKGIERLMTNLAKQGKIPDLVEGDVEESDAAGWENAAP